MSPTYNDCDCPLCAPSNPPPPPPPPPPESNIQIEAEPESDEQPPVITPLPKLQLSIVVCTQIAESVTSTVIHPFVNDLVRTIGVTNGKEKRTGYYVGAVESVFYGAQALTFLQWSRAADSVGRKPMMLGGTLGVAISMMGFGLSNNFTSVLLSRCAQGAFNGNVGVASSVMAEITDTTNAAQAFSFLPMARSIGSTLGPLIGGMLASPAQRWPDLFGTVTIFKDYPYLLPCLAAAAMPLGAGVLGSLGLKETLPSLVESKKQIEALTRLAQADESGSPTQGSPLLPSIPSASQAYGAITGYINRNAPVAPVKQVEPDLLISQIVTTATSTSYRELLIARVLVPIINFALLAFLDQSMLVLIPLIYSTPVHLGGLGLSPAMIGSILGVWGSINGFIQVYCFAWIRKHLGQRTCYMLGLVGLGVCFGLFPVLSRFAVWDGERVGCWVWLGISLQLGAYTLSYMSYACISMYIAASATSKSEAGSINSLSQLTVSGARSLAPSTASSLFAFSLELRFDRGYDLGGYLVYVVLCTLSAVALGWSFSLPKTVEGEGKQRQITE